MARRQESKNADLRERQFRVWHAGLRAYGTLSFARSPKEPARRRVLTMRFPTAQEPKTIKKKKQGYEL